MGTPKAHSRNVSDLPLRLFSAIVLAHFLLGRQFAHAHLLRFNEKGDQPGDDSPNRLTEFFSSLLKDRRPSRSPLSNHPLAWTRLAIYLASSRRARRA